MVEADIDLMVTNLFLFSIYITNKNYFYYFPFGFYAMSEFHLNKGIKRVFVVPGTLLSALDTLLTTKRRLQLKIRALTAHEVAVQLSSREPVYAEQVS